MLSPWLAILGAAVAAAVSLVLTPMVARLAEARGAMDLPAPRKVHDQPIPRWGGIAVLAGILAGYGVIGLNRLPTEFGSEFMLGFVGGSLLVFGIGAVDDRYRLGAPIKFTIQLAAAVLAYSYGIRFTEITVPWTGESMALGWIAAPATILWIVLVTNAWNLIDGLDGLAAMLGFIAATVFALLLIVRRMDAALILVVPMIGALAGFLPYNWNPARIFLGDSGSYLIGHQLALVSILTGQKGITSFAVFGPMVIVALPVIDTMVAVVRRLVRREAGGLGQRLRGVFQADQGHVHHRALARGWSQRKTLAVLSAFSLGMGVMGLVMTFARAPRLGGVLMLIAVVLFLLLYFDSQRQVGFDSTPAEDDSHPDSPGP